MEPTLSRSCTNCAHACARAHANARAAVCVCVCVCVCARACVRGCVVHVSRAHRTHSLSPLQDEIDADAL